MHALNLCLRALALCLLLAGCDQRALIEKFTPQEESAIAQQIISELAAGDLDRVAERLDPEIQGGDTMDSLRHIVSLFPDAAPIDIEVVGVNTSIENDRSLYRLHYQYQYPDIWLQIQVILQRRGGELTLLGLNVERKEQSLEAEHAFTFAGKSPTHFVVLAFAIFNPLFIAWTLFLCARTPMPKRKFWWYLFIALGFVQYSLNWSDGSHEVDWLSVQLLGAGFFSGAPFGPLILSISFPLGAVWFLVMRPALLARHAAAAPDGPPPP